MTAQSCKHVQSATLSGTTADTVAFTGNGKHLMVVNRHTAVLYFRIDGTTAVAAADECYAVPPGQSLTLGPSKFGAKTQLSIVGTDNPYTAQIF